MSDQAYATVQAQQKTSIGSSSKNSLLQRTCACGQHTLAGGECSTCRSAQSTLLRAHRAFEPPSAPVAGQGNAPAQEHGSSFHALQTTVPQTKLTINQPGDVSEQEADHVAEQVMRMTDAGHSVSDDEDEAPTSLMRTQSSEPQAAAGAALSSVPHVVQTVLNSGGGQPLDTSTRAFMEPRFGHDFSQVRVHSGSDAEQSAQDVHANAYTVGHNIVFGTGRFAPGTYEGRRLIAHELTHTIQQGAGRTLTPAIQRTRLSGVGGGLIQRDSNDSTPSTSFDVPSLDQQYNRAVETARQTGSWQDAAEKLNGFNHEDIQRRLAQLTADEVAYLHLGALDNPRVGPQSQVAQLTRPGTPSASTAPPIATQEPRVPAAAPVNVPSSTAARKPISDMTATEKLIEAYDRANINAAMREKLSSLITPKALVIAIISFAAVFIASQFTPVGWAADLGIALTAIFVGTALFTAIQHLINFANARNATTSEQLDQAGTEFAQAVAEVEVDAIILLVTHGIGGGLKGGVPYKGPPPTEFVLATTEEGVLVPVAANTISAETAAQLGLGIKASGISLVLMSRGSGPGGRTRDFEPPKLDHRTQGGGWKAGGDIPQNGAERNLAIESWTREDLEEAAHDLEQSISTRQAEQNQLGETSVGPAGQRTGAQHRERIEQEIDLLRAIRKKLGGT